MRKKQCGLVMILRLPILKLMVIILVKVARIFTLTMFQSLEIMFLMVQKMLRYIIQRLFLKTLFGIVTMLRFTIQLLMVSI